MIFVVSSLLSISINLLLVIFVFVCLLMGLVILMQRPKQDGLGAAFGGGVTDQVFGARTTNVLQKATVYLASLFFLLIIVLAILIGKQNEKPSLVNESDTAKVSENMENTETPVNVEPEKSLADELNSGESSEKQPEPVVPEEKAPGEQNPPPSDGASPPDTGAGSPVEGATPPVEGTEAPNKGAAPPAEGESEDKEKDSDKIE